MDWIETALDYTDGLPSPEIFRLWSAISTVAIALERRCAISLHGGRLILFPNVFVLLVGPPGSGKNQAIDPMRSLVRECRFGGAPMFKLAPKSITKAHFVDSLKAAYRAKMNGAGLNEYHSLAIMVPEIGTLLSAHDLEFLGVLNDVYDSPELFDEGRRHHNAGKAIDIVNAQVNILAGAQPEYLASLLPEQAWGMGFTSRLIMVYGEAVPDIDLFTEINTRHDLRSGLLSGLASMSERSGKFAWSEDAIAAMRAWKDIGRAPVPTHSKLGHYVRRRSTNALKLAMISSASRSDSMIITGADVARALAWLVDAESKMPDVFRAMLGKSDGALIDELHHYLYSIWAKDRKPIHESRLIAFLNARAPSEKINKIIEMAERANVLAREAGTFPPRYTPKPRHEHGIE